MYYVINKIQNNFSNIVGNNIFRAFAEAMRRQFPWRLRLKPEKKKVMIYYVQNYICSTHPYV